MKFFPFAVLLVALTIHPLATIADDSPKPHLVIVMAEQEYRTEETLPKFAEQFLETDFRVSLVHADPNDRNQIPGLKRLAEADVALISVRRRTPPPDQLQFVRDFVAAGKPVIGIRTASHAFSQRRGNPPPGHHAWPEFDAQVIGGNYTGHHSGEGVSIVRVIQENRDHQILNSISGESFRQSGTLYRVSPLDPGTTPLLMASQADQSDQPAAWTFQRADGGKSFYTSLGHPGDFDNPDFVRMLASAIYWAADLSIPAKVGIGTAIAK